MINSYVQTGAPQWMQLVFNGPWLDPVGEMMEVSEMDKMDMHCECRSQ